MLNRGRGFQASAAAVMLNAEPNAKRTHIFRLALVRGRELVALGVGVGFVENRRRLLF